MDKRAFKYDAWSLNDIFYQGFKCCFKLFKIFSRSKLF